MRFFRRVGLLVLTLASSLALYGFNPPPAQAATVCTSSGVALSSGGSCTVSLTGVTGQNFNAYFAYSTPIANVQYHIAITGPATGGGLEWSDNTNALCKGVGTTFSRNGTLVATITLTFDGGGTIDTKGDLNPVGCGGNNGGSGTVTCTTLSQTAIRWRATWKNVNDPVLYRAGVLVHYKDLGYSTPNGSGHWDETGLSPGTSYKGTLRDSGSGSNLAADSCRTRPTPGPSGRITCNSSTDTSITLGYTFSGTPSVTIDDENGNPIPGNPFTTSPGTAPAVTGLSPGQSYTFTMWDATGLLNMVSKACSTSAPALGPRIPYLTTIFNNLATYGDVHSGAVIRTSKRVKCNFGSLVPQSVHGSFDQSGVSSVISSTGPIFGFGSGGSQNPASRLRVGQSSDPTMNYGFPICQLELQNVINYTNNFAGRSKGKHISHSPSGNVIYIGSKGNDQDACGNKDVPRIVRMLAGTDPLSVGKPEQMIWCYVHVLEDVSPALHCISYDGQEICNNPSLYGSVDFNQPINLRNPNGGPIIIRGHKTLVIQAIPIRTSCSGGCHPIQNAGYSVRIGGNIKYDDNGGNGFSSTSELPSFALVDYASLKVAGAVTNLDGYYFAGVGPCARRGALRACFRGNIWTCPKSPKSGGNPCEAKLQVHGLLSANAVLFWRRGDGSKTAGPVVAEQIGGPEMGLVFVGAGPPGLTLSSGTGNCDPTKSDCTLQFSENEQPPLF